MVFFYENKKGSAMRSQVYQGTNGRMVVIYTPENEKDLEILYRMEEVGILDNTDYMHGEKKCARKKRTCCRKHKTTKV